MRALDEGDAYKLLQIEDPERAAMLDPGDTQRIARIIGVDGQADMVRIDPMQPEAVREIRDENNIVIDQSENISFLSQ